MKSNVSDPGICQSPQNRLVAQVSQSWNYASEREIDHQKVHDHGHDHARVHDHEHGFPVPRVSFRFLLLNPSNLYHCRPSLFLICTCISFENSSFCVWSILVSMFRKSASLSIFLFPLLRFVIAWGICCQPRVQPSTQPQKNLFPLHPHYDRLLFTTREAHLAPRPNQS